MQRQRRPARKVLGVAWMASKQIWKIAGIILAAVGLAGIPDDIATWERWIERASTWPDWAISDPRIQLAAQTAVHIADFVNQSLVRGLMFALSLIILGWAWRPFWRVRHKFFFWGKRLVAEQVWISREDALKVIAGSNWGRLKEPATTVSILPNFQWTHTSYGLSESQKKELLFKELLRRTLKGFVEDNPSAARNNNDEQEIDEVRLRKFLDIAMAHEVTNQFGEIPRHRVT